jgi:hypothetical protein
VILSDEITGQQAGECGENRGCAGYPNQLFTRRLVTHRFQKGRRFSLKSSSGFGEFADAGPKFAKGGHFPASQFIPMPLVDAEQLD